MKTHTCCLRSRLQMTIRPVYWFRLVTQVQDSRPFSQNPPWGPPNLNAWDLKLAFAEFGDPEKQWYSVRVGRQMINYNNTIIADSEWRNQARSYDAVVTNLHYSRYRLVCSRRRLSFRWRKGSAITRKGTTSTGLMAGLSESFPIRCWSRSSSGGLQQSVAIETTAKNKDRQAG